MDSSDVTFHTMNRKLKRPYTKRRLLDEDNNNMSNKDVKSRMLDAPSTSTMEVRSSDQASKKHYQLRELKKNYYSERSDSENKDFSSDHSEYFPSPDRAKTDSPSISSSLGGDSSYLENILTNNEIVTRPPSVISNLSSEFNLIDNRIFIASPTVIYKSDAFQTDNNNKYKRQPELWEQHGVIDISLKPAPTYSLAKTINETLSYSNATDAEKTLIDDENIDLDITLTDCADKNKINLYKLSEKSVVLLEETDSETKYPTNDYQILITIEPEDCNSEEMAGSDVYEKENRGETNSELLSSIETPSCHSINLSENIKAGAQIINSDLEEHDPVTLPIEAEDEGEEEAVTVTVQAEIHTQRRLIENHNDILDLSNESTVYEGENENNNQCQLSGDIEVMHSRADNRIDENIESIYNVEDDIMDSENTEARKLTRKRSINKSEWEDVKNKRLKNSGQGYEGCRSKKKYPTKTMKPSCTCQKKCGDKFTDPERTSLFNKFWNFGDHQLQWQYISRHTKTENIKKLTVIRKSTRTQTIKYFLTSETGEEIQVCKIFFLNTLGITEQMVFTTLEKNKKDEGLTDNRGKHDNRPHKIKSDTEENVIQHIKMFPTVESHYRRKESKREYLSELLNISKMYRLYQTWFAEQSYEPVNMATKRQYETIFNTRFNYSFFRPKKDQCTLCSRYKESDSEGKAILENQYRSHLLTKDKVREMKNNEKAAIKTNDDHSTSLAIYDLQKVLNIPQSEVSIFHYKRKYPVYNFTVFDAVNKKGYCYVWHSQIAKKGCTEIGSCLLKFMTSESERGIKKILFYSDGCGGQNKNRFIFALYKFAAKKLNLDITHKFFVTGHSQNEGDSMHSCIERNLKNKVIYTPDHIYGIIMNSKVSGHKYDLKEMGQDDILNIKSLVVPTNWKKDTRGEIIRWSEVMEVSVSHTTPDCLFFKYDFNEGPYLELNTSSSSQTRRVRGRGCHRGRGRGRGHSFAAMPILLPAYNELLPVSVELYNDLQSLCTSFAIPSYYHSFYNSLHYNNINNNNNKSDESDN